MLESIHDGVAEAEEDALGTARPTQIGKKDRCADIMMRRARHLLATAPQ
jgi:hypothetical protein